MARNSTVRKVSSVAALTGLLVGLVGIAQPAFAENDVVQPDDRLFVNPQSTTLLAASTLSGQARADAQLLGSFASGTWVTQGTPAEVVAEVDRVVDAAAADASVPVLVAYNLPFRDCAQYSAGGALDTAEYVAWIDAFADGIGDREAIVILEPDGLGIIPWYTTINGELEWCQPAELDPETAASNRFEQLNHAVDVISALPNTALYLDGTHSGWLGVGDITDRLIKSGIEKAEGVFLNASNYVETERLEKYGSWISDCVYLSTNSTYQPEWCGSQYYPADPADFSTWGLTDAAYDQAFADTGLVRDPAVQPHFVIDTSRNGQGPWVAPEGEYPDPEVWCNPPDRGLGLPPTTDTGNQLIDAYLWIKVPGESDGKCYRGTGGPLDPARGMEDPAAGQWFPEQARELIALANPPVSAQTCHVSYKPKGTHGIFAAQLKLVNGSQETVPDWELEWTFSGKERVLLATSAKFGQDGAHVTLSSRKHSGDLKAGGKVTVNMVGFGATAGEPLLFTLNGAPCTSD